MGRHTDGQADRRTKAQTGRTRSY